MFKAYINQGDHNNELDNKTSIEKIVNLRVEKAKLLGDKGKIREYSLDRLGVPLVEIALDPVEGDSKKIKKTKPNGVKYGVDKIK